MRCWIVFYHVLRWVCQNVAWLASDGWSAVALLPLSSLLALLLLRRRKSIRRLARIVSFRTSLTYALHVLVDLHKPPRFRNTSKPRKGVGLLPSGWGLQRPASTAVNSVGEHNANASNHREATAASTIVCAIRYVCSNQNIIASNDREATANKTAENATRNHTNKKVHCDSGEGHDAGLLMLRPRASNRIRHQAAVFFLRNFALNQNAFSQRTDMRQISKHKRAPTK